MKTKIGVVILVVVSVGLAVTLIVTNKQSGVLHQKDAATILDFSNQLMTAGKNLDDFRQVNLELTNELAGSRQESMTLSNDLVDTKSSLQREQEKVTGLNTRVTDLETRNQALDENLVTLSNTIASLSAQIADAQGKLSS